MTESVIDKLSTRILNGSTDPQKVDRFQARFLGIPENLSDFLSRQVQSLTPPAITFESTTHGNRRTRFRDVGKIEPETLSINIVSDGESIVDSILMAQVLRQKGLRVDGFGDGAGRERFDVKLEIFNANNEMVRTETYVNCFISSLQRPDLDTQTDTVGVYTLTLLYEEIDYSVEAINNFPLISS